MTNKFLGLNIKINNTELLEFLNKVDYKFRNMDSIYPFYRFTEVHKAEFACDNEDILKFVEDLEDIDTHEEVDKNRELGLYKSYLALFSNAECHKEPRLFFDVMYDIIDYLPNELRMISKGKNWRKQYDDNN